MSTGWRLWLIASYSCSLFLFLIRIIPQMTFLTPKPTYAPPLPHSYLSAIYVPNIVCLLFHIIGSRPEAGEAMRGYLHGGVIIDLIGYKGPTSKFHLFCLDLVVLAIQCLMLTVQVELKAVTVLLAAFRSNAASGTQPRVQVVSAQDHDAEEQGVVREGILSSGDAEVRALSPRIGSPSPHQIEADADRDDALLLEDPPPRDDAGQDNILGAMWAGSAIMADFHVISTLQTLWNDHRLTFSSDGTLQSMGMSAELAALRANRQLNAATQRIQRGVQALGD